VIKTFGDKRTEKFWNGQHVKLPTEILRRAMDKLYIIEHAGSLDELRVPPANRLEPLSGDRLGQHSIRINQQWRICFRWDGGNAHDVEITDYH